MLWAFFPPAILALSFSWVMLIYKVGLFVQCVRFCEDIQSVIILRLMYMFDYWVTWNSSRDRIMSSWTLIINLYLVCGIQNLVWNYLSTLWKNKSEIGNTWGFTVTFNRRMKIKPCWIKIQINKLNENI